MVAVTLFHSKRVRFSAEDNREIFRCVHAEWNRMYEEYFEPDREVRLEAQRRIMRMIVTKEKRVENSPAEGGD